MISILISSKNRLHLFRRTLWSISARGPSQPFEVIVADDGSEEDIVGELRQYPFRWKFISVDSSALPYKPFWNCPAYTNNVAFAHSSGEYIFQMGNEIIVWEDAFDRLVADLPKTKFAWAVSRTYDVPQSVLDGLDDLGTNLNEEGLSEARRWLLSNDNFVPNYLSVFTRAVWEKLGGYDEGYIAGIGAEDSDFMRRAMHLPGFQFVRSPAISLHQYHGGVSHFHRPLPHVISEARLEEGVRINRKLYHSWDGTHFNRQSWPAGTLGIKRVIES